MVFAPVASLLVLSFALPTPLATPQSRKLSDELARGNLNTGTVRLTPNGQHVLFSGTYEQTHDPVLGLFSAAADGSADPVRLWGHPTPSGSVSSAHLFRVTPDSSRVVFAVGDAYDGLLSAPVDGSAPMTWLAGSSGPFSRFLLTPDGAHTVFAMNATYPPQDGLFRVPVDGSSEPQPLFVQRAATSDFVDFQLTADGSRVVFTLDELDPACESCDVVNPVELYSVPTDGSAPATLLSRAGRPHHRPVEGVLGAFVSGFVLTPDGAHALYTEREQRGVCPEDCSFVTRLFSVPVDGTAKPLRLFAGDVAVPRISPDSSRVVYLGGPAGATPELLSQPIDASAPPQRLHRALASGGGVERFDISPDGRRVVFLADLSGSGATRLFVAPLDGSAPARVLGGHLPADRSVRDFRISPDSRHVVFLSDRRTDEVFELFRVPIDGLEHARLPGAPPQQVIALSDNGDIADFEITPEGTRVLFHAQEDEAAQLFSVPLDAGALPVRLSGAEGSSDLLITTAGRTVYRGSREHATDIHVYSAPLDGSAASAQVDDPSYGPVFGRVETFEIHPDGRQALFAAEGRDFRFPELSLVSLDRVEPPVLLEGLVPEDGILYDHRIDPGSGRVVYRATLYRYDEGYVNIELFSAPLDGNSAPVRLHDAMEGGGVFEFVFAGARVVHRTTMDNDRAELFSVPVDGSTSAIRLNPVLPDGATVSTFQLTPDATQVLFTANVTVAGRRDLFVVPCDGSAPPRQLNGPVAGTGNVGPYSITPDGARVLYVVGALASGPRGLYSAPIDGSAQPVLVSAPLISGREIAGLFVSPDSTRVVYFGDQDVTGLVEPFVAPVDGSASAVPLAPGQNHDVLQLQLSPDGERAVYVAVLGGRSHLYSVPIDASALPVQLDPLLPMANVHWVFPPVVTSDWVVYLARDAGDDVWAVPIDGSAPAHRINAPLPSNRSVDRRFAVARGRVVFLMPDDDYRPMLFEAPVDGSRAPRQINPPGTFSGSNYRAQFAIHPDGQRILFLATDPTIGEPELHLGFLGRGLFPWHAPDESLAR